MADNEKTGGMLPEGDSLRRAMRWMGDRRAEDATVPRHKLIDEAALRFDLSPSEVEFLLLNWKES
jgi:ribosomal protein S18 acetylase RimI-like enzyme